MQYKAATVFYPKNPYDELVKGVPKHLIKRDDFIKWHTFEIKTINALNDTPMQKMTKQDGGFITIFMLQGKAEHIRQRQQWFEKMLAELTQ